MADIVGAIFGALSCICGTPTCNCIDQYQNFNDDVGELRRILDNLTNRKQDIESRIEEAEACAGQVVRREVQDWPKQAQEINVDVRAFLEKVQGVKWYKRACLDKHVCRKIKVVEDMFEKGRFPEGAFIERAPAHGNIIPIENLVGGSTKEEIWRSLMGDEVGLIGVCGIGGVGKTTIMKNLHNDLQRGTRFQKVIWVTVSYPINVFELQRKVADAMDKRLQDDEDVMMRAGALMEIMRRVRFVLILDDVWEKFSLSDIGIPKPTLQNGCKVVITSRSVEVCQFLGCEIVKVQPLSQEESLNLFLDKVGHAVLQNVPELEETLKLMVKECAGLPLAIVVIAGSMKGVDDIKVWRNALTELQECVKSVKGSEDEIFMRLKFSFDRLPDEKIKNCFLYCSLFREDYSFKKEELIEGWIDEGLMDGLRSREAAYDRGHAFLDVLEKNSLLEKHFTIAIKMRDVVRDMAIRSIGTGVGYMVKTGMKLTKVPNEYEWARDLNKVSLMANYISEIPVGLTPKCPTLSTLILSDNPLTKIPKSFFKDMSGLKVLDLSGTYIEALPSSISKLKYLSVLRLSGCKRLKCLPSLKKLVALKKLDLRWAGIEVVPQGMEMLVSLEYLDLLCENLKKIPTGILFKLSSLQYLVVTDDKGICSVKINLKETARLRKLEIIECKLEDMQGFSYFLSELKNFQNLTAYKLVVGTMRNWFTDIDNPKYKCRLIIGGCDIGEELIVLLDNLQYLQIHNCKNIRSSLNKTVLLENATELSICIITCCEEIEYVVELDSSSFPSYSPILDKLESLFLESLPRLWALMRVEGVTTPPCVFSNLKTLHIVRCSGMRNLLPLELLQTFQNLEVIWVNNCEQMEEIISSSDSDTSSSNKCIFTFPKLRELHLTYLPQLKSICKANRIMVCDSIEEIQIRECPKLKRIPLNPGR
ncbi:hypothetical protein SLEP1_g51632 [Rubroshorea leprosula]|uniref:AAA+ ATPase domain-containing protein n=1 Tax=Rubroshorea leprosula TaxID=152421 RepID=A0AAV5M6B9_9ROSI|nr:hypothetical protein SLEP1_g51632 [Rubroshorea leprosula]